MKSAPPTATTGTSESPATASQERRAAERQAVRERILRAGRELLIAEGLAKFSMRKLADRIGYTATALYFHFPDKESLLGEVVDQQFREFRQAFEVIGQQPDPIQRVAAMGLAFLQFGLEHPDYYRLMFLTSLQAIPKGRTLEKGNPSQDCYAFLLATVEEGLQAGRFAPAHRDAQELAQIFFSSVHGIVAMQLIKGDDDWVDWRPIVPKTRKMIEALIGGLTGNLQFQIGPLPQLSGSSSASQTNAEGSAGDTPASAGRVKVSARLSRRLLTGEQSSHQKSAPKKSNNRSTASTSSRSAARSRKRQ